MEAHNDVFDRFRRHAILCNRCRPAPPFPQVRRMRNMDAWRCAAISRIPRSRAIHHRRSACAIYPASAVDKMHGCVGGTQQCLGFRHRAARVLCFTTLRRLALSPLSISKRDGEKKENTGKWIEDDMWTLQIFPLRGLHVSLMYGSHVLTQRVSCGQLARSV